MLIFFIFFWFISIISGRVIVTEVCEGQWRRKFYFIFLYFDVTCNSLSLSLFLSPLYFSQSLKWKTNFKYTRSFFFTNVL